MGGVFVLALGVFPSARLYKNFSPPIGIGGEYFKR